MLNSLRSANRYPQHLRRIRFKDPETGKTLFFLTHNTTLPVLTICALYKCRWTVELFFKWIKQHWRIKKFLGTSENAVKTLVWCAIATYVLIAIIKKESNDDRHDRTSSMQALRTTDPSRPRSQDMHVQGEPWGVESLKPQEKTCYALRCRLMARADQTL